MLSNDLFFTRYSSSNLQLRCFFVIFSIAISVIGPSALKVSVSEFNSKLRKLVGNDPESGRNFCTICQKVFTRVDKAMDHLRLLHLNRFDFCCFYCKELFKTSTLRSAHVKKYHFELHKLKKALGDDFA